MPFCFAYSAAAASIIGRTTSFIGVIQSETNVHWSPSHCCTRIAWSLAYVDEGEHFLVVYDRETDEARVIVEDAAALKAAAKKNKWKLSARKTVFLVHGDDRLGAIHEVIAKLADKKIGITALDAVSAGAGRYGAMFWVKPKDLAKASKALGLQTPAAARPVVPPLMGGMP